MTPPFVPAHRPPVWDASLDCFRLPLTRGRFALIDAQDAPATMDRCWTVKLHRSGPSRPRDRLVVEDHDGRPLARRLLSPGPRERVLHLNGDPLDLRRANLRLVSDELKSHRHPKRSGVSSRFRGVSVEQSRGLYRAKITVAGKVTQIGRFESEEAAARAYDAAAEKHYGELAILNFPDAGRTAFAVR